MQGLTYPQFSCAQAGRQGWNTWPQAQSLSYAKPLIEKDFR